MNLVLSSLVAANGSAGGEMGLGRSLRVLVVEDDGAQRHLLRMALNKRGHALVAEASRGDDPEISRVACDVAIVDLGMPGKSGVEVIHALQDRRVPVLVLSANAHSAAVTEALLAGALGYVVKGARLSEVIDAMELVADKKQVIPPRTVTPPSTPPPPAPAHALRPKT